jgi:hypothetical protein
LALSYPANVPKSWEVLYCSFITFHSVTYRLSLTESPFCNGHPEWTSGTASCCTWIRTVIPKPLGFFWRRNDRIQTVRSLPLTLLLLHREVDDSWVSPLQLGWIRCSQTSEKRIKNNAKIFFLPTFHSQCSNRLIFSNTLKC